MKLENAIEIGESHILGPHKRTDVKDAILTLQANILRLTKARARLQKELELR